MMKASFFLDNSSFYQTDCSNVLDGNPGIGGTEWLILTVATLLNQRNNGISICLYVTENGLFPEALHTTKVADLREAMTVAKSDGVEKLTVKHLAQNVCDDVFSQIPAGLDIIIWSHIFVSYWELDYYADKEQIRNIVFVGRETADLYRDHKAFQKTSYIYNCVNLSSLRKEAEEHPFAEREHIVTYMGSLVPFKGFHLLAEAWPTILRTVPDAELYVIGDGRLYDSNNQLGRYGLAESGYEESFMKHLTLDDGSIMPSVHFMGRMGIEKNEILLKTKVGVPNPSGITETFCLCAVEMQAAGAMVTTIDYPGFLDTVRNGRLYHRHKDLASNVIKLLKEKTDRFKEASNFFECEFSYETVAGKWEHLLTGNLDKEIKLTNPGYRFKWFKELRAKASSHLPSLYKLPITERILLFLERKFNGRTTYLDS